MFLKYFYGFLKFKEFGNLIKLEIKWKTNKIIIKF